jgi:predicted nucleotidyltransferase
VTTIKQIKFIIYQVLSTNKSLSCYLFGSYAKGKQNENSDVDILIIVDKEQYEYKQITNIKEQIKNEFEKINIYCDPIFGYIQNINEDKSILFREYIGYGKFLFGNDLSTEILQETAQEQKQIEYEKYWRAMMFEKIRTLEYLVSVDKNIDDSSLAWEFLYLIVYWNGKAELTLVDKQHSLNEFTLIYIYTELLKNDFDYETLHTLNMLQYYRDQIKSGEYFDIEFESFNTHFTIVKNKIITN